MSQAAKLILAPVRVNGEGPFDFILDTGNGSFPVLISKALADRISVNADKDSTETGFAVEFDRSFNLGVLDSFEIGDIKADGLKTAVGAALDQIANRFGQNICGNIGFPFLKNYKVTVDCQSQTLTFSNGFETQNGIPFETNPLILVEVLANGVSFTFALDTGASGTCISYAAAERLDLTLGKPVSLNRSETPNSHLASLTTLEVSQMVQRNVQVAVAQFIEELNCHLETQIDGVLGMNFWGKYRMTIDYPNSRLLLEEH
jgi:predicted aspartyl protease